MIRSAMAAVILLALPASARGRGERIREVEELINRALELNDEHDSGCQMEMEHKLEKLKGDVRRAAESDEAIERALKHARSIRESAEDDCPGRLTQALEPLLDTAAHKLRRILEADDDAYDSEGEGDYGGEEWAQPVEPPPPAVAVEIEPPVVEPAPIAVAWAPPPMLVEVVDPFPGAGWFWVGGFWTWQGEWVWVHGHWRQPPQVGYTWCQPYYENRNGLVVFVSGHWRPEDRPFVPPAPSLTIVRVQPRAGIVAGPPPSGPSGIFVPPPPGSRPGVIVAAPLGTPPAVVVSAPPVVKPGMRIEGHFGPNVNVINASVKVIAPAGVTQTGKPVQASVPAAAHLAAARPPVVRAMAPAPVNTKPLPAFNPKAPPPVLAKAQPIHVTPPPPRPPAPPPGHPVPQTPGRPTPPPGRPGAPPPKP